MGLNHAHWGIKHSYGLQVEFPANFIFNLKKNISELVGSVWNCEMMISWTYPILNFVYPWFGSDMLSEQGWGLHSTVAQSFDNHTVRNNQ